MYAVSVCCDAPADRPTAAPGGPACRHGPWGVVHAVVAYGGLMCAHAVCGGWPIDPRPATLPDAPDDRRPAMMGGADAWVRLRVCAGARVPRTGGCRRHPHASGFILSFPPPPPLTSLCVVLSGCAVVWPMCAVVWRGVAVRVGVREGACGCAGGRGGGGVRGCAGGRGG